MGCFKRTKEMLIITKEKLEGLLETHTRVEVAKMLNCTEKTIYNKAKMLGIKARKNKSYKDKISEIRQRTINAYWTAKNNMPTAEMHRLIVQERYDGASVAELAKKYNKSKHTIYKIISKHNRNI